MIYDGRQNTWSDLDLEALFYKAPIGVAVVSTKGQFLRVNEQLCHMLEYTSSELLDRTFDEITHTADIKTDWREVDLCLSGMSNGYTLLKKYICKSDKVIHTYLHVCPIRNGDKVTHFLSFIVPVDVTHSKDGHKVRNEIEEVSDKRILNFVKENWIKIITAIGLSFGAVGQYYKDKENQKHESDKIHEKLQEFEKREDEMKKILEDIQKSKQTK